MAAHQSAEQLSAVPYVTPVNQATSWEGMEAFCPSPEQRSLVPHDNEDLDNSPGEKSKSWKECIRRTYFSESITDQPHCAKKTENDVKSRSMQHLIFPNRPRVGENIRRQRNDKLLERRPRWTDSKVLSEWRSQQTAKNLQCNEHVLRNHSHWNTTGIISKSLLNAGMVPKPRCRRYTQ